MFDRLKRLIRKPPAASGAASPGNVSPFEQCAGGLREVLGFYRAQGCCPCAFPRFVQLVGFDFRTFGTGPVGCHAAEMGIGMCTGGGGFFHAHEQVHVCSVCGSEATVKWEQFNINLDVTTMTWNKLCAVPRGAAPEKRIPMPSGFFGFQQKDIARCAAEFATEGSFAQMVSYLTATA